MGMMPWNRVLRMTGTWYSRRCSSVGKSVRPITGRSAVRARPPLLERSVLWISTKTDAVGVVDLSATGHSMADCYWTFMTSTK